MNAHWIYTERDCYLSWTVSQGLQSCRLFAPEREIDKSGISYMWSHLFTTAMTKMQALTFPSWHWFSRETSRPTVLFPGAHPVKHDLPTTGEEELLLPLHQDLVSFGAPYVESNSAMKFLSPWHQAPFLPARKPQVSLFLSIMQHTLFSFFFVFLLFLLIVLLLSHTTKYASARTFFLEADCFHYYLPSKYNYLLPERSSGCSVPACVPTEIIRKDLTGFTMPWMKTSNQILPLCEMSSLPQISQVKF